MNEAKIWWKYIPSARRFRKKAIELLMDDNSVNVIIPQNFPYLEEFINEIETKTLQFLSDRSVRSYNSEIKVEEWIKNNFYSEEEIVYLNPRLSLAKNIAKNENTNFHSMLIVIATKNKENIKDWFQFISTYYREMRKKRAAVFLIVGMAKEISVQNVYQLDYTDYANSYDYQAFAALLSAELNIPNYLKPYLSELAVSCGNSNAEKIAKYIKDHKNFLKNPQKLIESIDLTSKEIDSLIWKAQIRIVYPKIEDFRQTLIDKKRKDLEAFLPIFNAFGEEITKPEDLEIGTLSYLIDFHKMILPCEMKSIYQAFKEGRNKLAHISILSYYEVCTLLEWNEEK